MIKQLDSVVYQKEFKTVTQDGLVSQGLVKSVNIQTQRLPAETVSQYVSYHAVIHVNTPGHLQKKGIRPVQYKKEIKYVKGISCVDPCLSAPIVQSAPSVVNNVSVMGRLQRFWQTWENLGSNPRVISILREGYALPFKMRPPFTRSPVIMSGYADLVKNCAKQGV